MKIILSCGAQWHTLHQVDALVKNGYLQKFITGISKNKILNNIANINRERIISFYRQRKLFSILSKFGYKKHYLNFLNDDFFDYRLSRKLDEECDIFHFYNGFGLRTLRKSSIKYKKSVVECGIHPRFYKTICEEEFSLYGNAKIALDKKYLIKSEKEFEESDIIITNSHFAKESFLKFGYSNNKIKVVPLGVDTSRFFPSKDKKPVFTVLFVGRITVLKGVSYLLKAIEKLIIDGLRIRLLMIGPIEDKYTKRILSKYENSVWLKVLGKISNRELTKYYSSSHVTVLPSIIDSNPMVVYESLACGTPVIISNNVGAEIVENENGFRVPIRDSVKIAEKILFLYNNTETCYKMSENGRKFAKTKTWDTYAKTLIKTYKEIFINE